MFICTYIIYVSPHYFWANPPLFSQSDSIGTHGDTWLIFDLDITTPPIIPKLGTVVEGQHKCAADPPHGVEISS